MQETELESSVIGHDKAFFQSTMTVRAVYFLPVGNTIAHSPKHYTGPSFGGFSDSDWGCRR